MKIQNPNFMFDKKKKKNGLQKILPSKRAFSKKYGKEMDYQTDLRLPWVLVIW